VADYTQRGGELRVLTLIDEFTRECNALHADRSITAAQLLKVLAEYIRIHGEPACRFRLERLDRELLYTLGESRVVFADWDYFYNYVRPHLTLGLLTPRAYAKKLNDQGCGTVRLPGCGCRKLDQQNN